MKIQSISFLLVAVVACCTILTSCKKDDDFDAVAQYHKEVAAIDEYLDANYPNAVKDYSGVRMVITELGTGLPAQLLSTVNVDYQGRLFSNNNVFDEGNLSGQLISTIVGWQYALTILPVGSKATIYIPSALAYGNSGSAKIPANSTLVFDITFNSMTQTPLFNQQFQSDKTAVEQYLANKSINAVADPLGIYYVITNEGTGESPGWYKPVKHTYSFRLLSNDTQITGTYDREPTDNFASRPVDYIQGVAYVLTKLKPGGKATIYIPSGLGFGINTFRDQTTGQVVVPANTNIIVDIELKEVL